MFIGAVAALALLVGFIYLARATPIYTATAQILLDPQRQRVTGADSRFERSSVRLCVLGEPANHHQIGPAAAARGHKGAARTAAADNRKRTRKALPTRMQNQQKPNAFKLP